MAATRLMRMAAGRSAKTAIVSIFACASEDSVEQAVESATGSGTDEHYYKRVDMLADVQQVLAEPTEGSTTAIPTHINIATAIVCFV
jgi:hypothetical protein